MLDKYSGFGYNSLMMIEKELKMKGSIRAIVGLLIVFAAAGGLDNATDAQLLPVVAVACVGLFVMLSGVKAMEVK